VASRRSCAIAPPGCSLGPKRPVGGPFVCAKSLRQRDIPVYPLADPPPPLPGRPPTRPALTPRSDSGDGGNGKRLTRRSVLVHPLTNSAAGHGRDSLWSISLARPRSSVTSAANVAARPAARTRVRYTTPISEARICNRKAWPVTVSTGASHIAWSLPVRLRSRWSMRTTTSSHRSGFGLRPSGGRAQAPRLPTASTRRARPKRERPRRAAR
jgi:hypothetical protein